MASRLQKESTASGRVCETCTRNTADFFCECSGSKKYFCEGCFPSHNRKYPGFLHNLVRADIDASEVAGIQERAQVLAAGRAELLQNLNAIDQCCSELESIVQLLTQYLNDQLAQLRALKATLAADIEHSVREVENSLAAQEVHFQGKYSAFLRSHVPNSLVLFHYQLDSNFFNSCCSNLLTYTLKNPMTQQQLVRFSKRTTGDRMTVLEAFEFPTHSWRTVILSQPVPFGPSSVYTGVDSDRVFCCGFRPSSTASIIQADYLVHCTSGQVEQLPPLSIDKCGPGVLHDGGELFVFGRKAYADFATDFKPGREVEMLQLASRKREWIRLPDMNIGRCFFTPCVYKGSAYLYLCWENDTSIDILELQTRRFLAPLSITLPEDCTWAVTFSIGDEGLSTS